jgi:hypothetical protein
VDYRRQRARISGMEKMRNKKLGENGIYERLYKK